MTRAEIVSKALIQAVELGLENISLGPVADFARHVQERPVRALQVKEALQLAVMAEAIERFKVRVIAPALRTEAGEPRLRALFKNYLRWIDGTEDLPGCLFVGTAQEYDDRPGPLRDILASTQLARLKLLASSAEEAIRTGRSGILRTPRRLRLSWWVPHLPIIKPESFWATAVRLAALKQRWIAC